MHNEKYRQFFTYLKEYYKLRETAVKDFTTSKKYGRPVWLEELAACEGTRSRLLNHPEEDEAVVLTLRRPARSPERPTPPSPPDTLQAWLTGETDDHSQAPRLEASRELPPDPTVAGDRERVQWLYEDGPLEVRGKNYLLDHADWRDAMAEYLPLREAYDRHRALYSTLFAAHNKLEDTPERYELVLGFGVFYWKDGKGHTYRRPLLTLPLETTLRDNGTLNVRIAVENELIRLENDFIAGHGALKVPEASRATEERIGRDYSDLWSLVEQQLPVALETFASRLSEDAGYLAERALPQQSPTQPTVCYAPVFVLRERSQRSYTVLFDQVLDHLSSGEELHLPLLDRIVHGAGYAETETNTSAADWGWASDRIALPKMSNAEQLKILEAVGRRDMVVVQGPPGTGKSHSIANVLTYLLGQGKKVLVTAKTDQALQALQEHIPQSFADLIVFFLQGADKHGDELVASVNSLQRLIEDYEPTAVRAQVATQSKALEDYRRQRAGLLHAIREVEQGEHRPTTLNEAYRDRPLHELIDRLSAARPDCEWLQSETSDTATQLDHRQLLTGWLALYGQEEVRNFDPTTRAHLATNRLPPPERLAELNALRQQLSADFNDDDWRVESSVSPREYRDRLTALLSFSYLPDTQPWHKQLRQSYETGTQQSWERTMAATGPEIEVLDTADVEALYRNYEFTVPAGISSKQLVADVGEVLDYVGGGGKLTGIFSKLTTPAAVKQRRYVYTDCYENGHPCTSEDQLHRLARHASITRSLEELDASWRTFPVGSHRTADRCREYSERQRQLTTLIIQWPKYLRARTQVQSITGRATQELQHPSANQMLTRAGELHTLRTAIAALETEFAGVTDYVTQTVGEDRQGTELIATIDAGDLGAYRRLRDDFVRLSELVAGHETLRRSEMEVMRIFPNTIRHLRKQSPDSLPGEARVTAAIFWRDADNELSTRYGEGLDELYQRIKRVDADIRDTAQRELKLRAVGHFVDGLNSIDAFSSTLTRWMQAAKHSSGNSKRAFRSRIESKDKLRAISQDIPCWVMPIYKLANTLGPQPEIFDVVIVDEASQLGPEASFLQYIAKRIIVVGDDQQTAPEGVGISDDVIGGLIRTHLSGIPDAKYYQKEYSFFDHASANAGRSITLREHFRCMPEIIEFSNQICYRPLGTELLPLKQHGSDRLKPLQSVFVRQGSASRAKVNRAEAEAIVECIAALIKQERYAGLTVGVITLLGDKQAQEIEQQLDAAYGNTIDIAEKSARRLRVGKPADFQGDERDIILLSLVVAPDYSFRALTGANDQRRFNVAMSRAKQQVILFHSVRLEDLSNPNDLRYKLLHYFRHQHTGVNERQVELPVGPRDEKPTGGIFDSWFEVDIYRAITARGYRVEPQYEVGPYRIDLVVHLDGGARIAVECDGDYWHGEDQQESDMRRQLQLERAGWTFYRILYSAYRYRGGSHPGEALGTAERTHDQTRRSTKWIAYSEGRGAGRTSKASTN